MLEVRDQVAQVRQSSEGQYMVPGLLGLAGPGRIDDLPCMQLEDVLPSAGRQGSVLACLSRSPAFMQDDPFMQRGPLGYGQPGQQGAY